MATHGELTVGKLKQFLNAFSEDTKVFMGSENLNNKVYRACHANTYYPPGMEEDWPIVIIDVGDNM